MTRGRAIRHGLSLAGFVVIAWFVLVPGMEGMGFDARAYWDVDLTDPYARSLEGAETFLAFRYSPPVALAMAPLHLLPWPVFLAAWTALLVAVLVWLTREWALAAGVLVGVPMSIYLGNVDLLIAASIVLGLRYPAVWALPILTKVTPVLGLLWFAARGEWRALAIAVVAVAVIALPTVVLWPQAWSGFVSVVVTGSTAESDALLLPLWLRLPIAAALIVVAARSDRPWLLAIGVMLAQPFFTLRATAVGVAAIALARRRGPAGVSSRGW